MAGSFTSSRLAIALPVMGGLVLLGLGVLVLPGNREVNAVVRHGAPAFADPQPFAPSRPARAAGHRSELAQVVRGGSLDQLLAMVAQLDQSGRRIRTAQVVYDLRAAGRAETALAFLDRQGAASEPSLWLLRFELCRELRWNAEASGMLEAAARGKARAAPEAIVAGAYELHRLDLLVSAAAVGAIPRLDAMRAADVARHAERAGRPDLIAALDAVSDGDWRRLDPWLAMRLARRSGNAAEALRLVPLLPADQRAAAKLTLLAEQGDRGGQRALLLAQSSDDPRAAAEQLLTLGFRGDAVAVLERAVETNPRDQRSRARLLFLLGPRPAERDLAWLRARALSGGEADQLAWLQAYAERAPRAEVAVTLTHHPLAHRSEVLLLRLAATADARTAKAIVGELLDGRPLSPQQLRAIGAAMPRSTDAATRLQLTRRRIAAGIPLPADRTDLAWALFQAGDTLGAIRWLDQHLRVSPQDVAALRLMAEVQQRAGGSKAAHPWLERVLSVTPSGTQAYVELLDRLERRSEALALVQDMRRAAPRDRSLAALQARILVADGQPGKARKVLAP